MSFCPDIEYRSIWDFDFPKFWISVELFRNIHLDGLKKLGSQYALMPDPKTYKQHFQSKHPKAALPLELVDVQA
uniref:Uncharacterized protein n=1 Tax=Wuchereria bancrofti TaxID=6293 RepID=A0AAF5Q6G8_WUCBA